MYDLVTDTICFLLAVVKTGIYLIQLILNWSCETILFLSILFLSADEQAKRGKSSDIFKDKIVLPFTEAWAKYRTPYPYHLAWAFISNRNKLPLINIIITSELGHYAYKG